MPVCHFKRAHFSRIFAGEASYGYCVSKDAKYYGFKSNLLLSYEGVIRAAIVTQANIHERESL